MSAIYPLAREKAGIIADFVALLRTLAQRKGSAVTQKTARVLITVCFALFFYFVCVVFSVSWEAHDGK